MLGVSEKIFSNPVYSVLSPSLLYIYLYCPINIPNEYVVHKTYCSYTYEASLSQTILIVNNFDIWNGRNFWKEMSKCVYFGVLCPLFLLYQNSFINFLNLYVGCKLLWSYTYKTSLSQVILNVNNFYLINGSCFSKHMSKIKIIVFYVHVCMYTILV